jgi:hypothetical protein
MNDFRRIYPGKGRLLFDGGKNSKYDRSLIEDNESPDCANVVFTNGSVETRQGAVKVNTAPVTANAFDGLYTRRDQSNAETMVAFAGGSMYQLVGTSFTTIPSAQSVFTMGARVATAQFQNYMFIGNGGVIPYKWNGTNFTRHGVYPPTTTATVASNGVGNLTASGQYRYKFTFVNSGLVESDVGPLTATFTISATSGQNTLSNIPTAPQSYGVNSRNIYRNASSGTTYKRVATISDNTTTTYNDNIADSSLGVDAPTDQAVPPKFTAIIYHAQRLFMNDPANPNFVWYTDIDSGGANPFIVPTTNFFKVGDNATDLVYGFGVYENAVLCYCENSVWINYMPTATDTDWKQVRAKSPHGTKSPFGIVDYNDKQLFPAMQNKKFVGFGSIKGGVQEITTTNMNVFSVGSETKSDRVEPDMFQVQESLLNGISGIVYKNRAYLSVPYGSTATANNRIYVFDFSLSNIKKSQEGSWVPWTGLNAAQFTILSGNLYYASSDSTGFVFKLESGVYSDNGAAIDSYFWTKEFSGTLDEYNYYKDFRYASLLVENVGNYYINIGYRVDSDSGSGNFNQVTVNPGGSLWGTMVWGLGLWGGGSNQKEYRQFLGTARGKRIQLRFDNQNKVDQRFKIHGLNFMYNIKGYR